MPSNNVILEMLNRGIDLSKGVAGRYNVYDSLATYIDLSKLFEVLTSVRDSNNNHCVVTAMSVVANPDFDLIAQNDFRQYFYEPFKLTLQKYPGCEKSFELWKEGISLGIFIPEFHGREHLNFLRWMEALRNGDHYAHLAFKYNFWGYPRQPDSYQPNRSLQAAFDIDQPSDIDIMNEVISDGLNLFRELFGYSASCFTPPNGPLNRINEKKASEEGIKAIQTARMFYKEPIGNEKTRMTMRYLGKRNDFGQIYLIRNCFFEPCGNKRTDVISKCLDEVEQAFKCNKPAILSSHRVNYIGALKPENRDNGLILLKELLESLVKLYPDIEFISSTQLTDLILRNEL